MILDLIIIAVGVSLGALLVWVNECQKNGTHGTAPLEEDKVYAEPVSAERKLLVLRCKLGMLADHHERIKNTSEEEEILRKTFSAQLRNLLHELGY